ncbi:MAG: hypothetical protein CMF31_07790 [Kordiimonas sp.]|nr:hypothetical protein [Kordiimonas sp.]|tara:strand:- start:524 stop:1471 length:948 start_codon:yes stop_codon:yes gene_type:complete
MPIQFLKRKLTQQHTQWLLKGLQWLFALTIMLYLAIRLTEIGWVNVWQNLPDNPLFYLLFILIYFALPTSEMLVYRLIWNRSLWRHFGVFVRKRVYNVGIMGYSGEAYLLFWAQQKLGYSYRAAFSAVKDNNILSALASNGMTVLLLIIFAATGQLDIVLKQDPDYATYLLIAALGLALLIPVILRFRRHIIALSAGPALKVFILHSSRLTIVMLLQALQWSVALPSVAFDTWVIFLTAQMIMTRIPFLPSQDLLFLGLGLSMAGLIDAPLDAVAAMFLAAGALSQAMNAGMYIVTFFTNSHNVIDEKTPVSPTT